MTSHTPSLCFATLLVGLLPLLTAGSDWPVFLGPNGNSSSQETNLLKQIPNEGIPILWEHKIGTGYNAPSILDGQLVLFHREGNEEVVQAYDATTGKPGWRNAHPSRFVDPYGYNNGPRCTPLLTSNRVYTFGAEGKLTAWDRASGKQIWQRDTAKEFEVPEAFFGVGSTPLLEGNQLLVMVGGQPDSGVVSFDTETGKTQWERIGSSNWEGQPMLDWPGERTVAWRRWEKSASYASLISADIHGHRIVFALMRQGLVGLKMPEGEVLFSRWFRARVDDSVNAMTPLIDGSRILISSAYARSGSVLLDLPVGGGNPTEIWKGLALEMHWSQPQLVDGHLFGFSGRNEPDAVFRCVEMATGKIKWERPERWGARTTRQPDVFGRGSLLLADGHLWALGEGGLLGLFEPNTDECKEIGRWQVPSLQYPCWTAPVLVDGRLYLRSENRLVCLDISRQRK